VAPKPSRRRKVAADPREGVGQEEFEELVANLGVESRPVVAPPRQKPAGGRRARSQQGGDVGARAAGSAGGGTGSAPGAGDGGEVPPSPAARDAGGSTESPQPADDAAAKARKSDAARKERRKHGRTR
jgi:hypothetical protein